MKFRNSALLTVTLTAAAAAQFAPPQPQDVRTFGAGVQRTMSLLAGATAAKRNTVRVMFYGQSITKQGWWRAVAADLRQRYPLADLVVVNRALGGFSTPLLKRTIESDLIAWYPDLVIFHDYGDEPDYEWMIRQIRSRTTAEIAIQTDYYTWLPEAGKPAPEADVKRNAWHDKHCFEWLRDLCSRYGLEYMDVRKPWLDYLTSNKLRPADLLSDGTHMNAHGEFLLTELVKPHLRYDPSLPDTGWHGWVRDLVVGKDVEWKDGRLEVEFEGNRVDLMSSRVGRQPYARASILVDGKRPSEFPELYAVTKQSDLAGADWPFVIHVGANAPLQVEEWFLKITETDAGNKVVRFEVRGSKTGPDGAGISTERFVSKSGRVVLEPEDWHLQRAFDYAKVLTPVGAETRWQVVPLFLDIYEPPRRDDATREYPLTVAQGIRNGKHKLVLTKETLETPQIEAIRVYRPPLEETPQAK